MPDMKLVVIYPRPKDVDAFEKVYQDEHVPLAVAKTGREDQDGCNQDTRLPARYGSFLPDCGSLFPVDRCAGSMRGVGRRQGGTRSRCKDFVGRGANFPGSRRRDFHVHQKVNA